MKFISLFAGIGGFDLALTRLGHTCVYANEWDKYAAQIYDKNFSQDSQSLSEVEQDSQGRDGTLNQDGSDSLLLGHSQSTGNRIDTRDIRTVPTEEIPDHDLLVGGFPCQAFSIAGKRRGFDDTRGTLFFEIARILRAKKPRLFILENVKGLLSSHTTLTFDGIVDSLSKELSVKENICLNNFQPIQEWEIESDNLSVYLQSIGGTSGLQKNYQSLLEKTLPIIKKQNFYPKEKTEQSDLNENEWVSSLQQLSSIDSLNMADIPLLEKMVVTNGDFVQSLKNKLEENSNQLKLSTTSTETNLMTDLKICISVLQELNIILFITKQWKLSTNLWNKIKSPSKMGGTYYVKTFNIILSTLDELGYDLQWQVLNSKNFGVPQNRERVFIIGNLRGTSRSEVFPVRNTNENNSQPTKELPEQISNTLRTNYSNGKSNETYVGEGKEIKIRRLTPTECERLQGFPDGWTEGISDTQRYKCLGNAVTVNVISYLVSKL